MTSRSRLPWLVLTLVLVVLIALAAAGALMVGAAQTSPEIVWAVRAPRVAMALVVGAGLAAAGVLMQGALRNPLADPALVGISSGAALGAVVAAVLGVSFSSWGSGTAATIGAAAAMALVTWVSMRDGRPEVVTLLLSGVAVAAFAGALVSIAVAMSDSAAVRSWAFWSAGSLALSTWPAVLSVIPFIVIGLILAMTLTHGLDVLALGDRDAYASGVPVARVRWLALSAAVLVIGAGVAAVGVIAFLGLVIPHAVRSVIGPRTRPLLIVSVLVGALALLGADTLARVSAAPIEIPVGAITALIGAPVFFILLRVTRRRSGGWA